MKITKRQLRRIIKEEKQKILTEQSRESLEGTLIGELAGLLADLQGVKHELYGLTDPDGAEMGSVYGDELEATILELENWADKLEKHFGSSDGTRKITPTEDESGIPDNERSVIHNRRPEW
jgi:hypothetical protein